jgi:SprT-like protein
MSGQLCSDEQLQKWVERISMSAFGWPFVHQARFNRRLRRAGGRYDLRSHDIEINPAQLRDHGPEEVERIIKHELCHYHLHLQGRGYRHRDRDFKELLAIVGGTRFCRPLASQVKFREGRGGVVRPVFRYVLKCRSCAQEYPRRIRCNPARYICRRCRGSLDLFEWQGQT